IAAGAGAQEDAPRLFTADDVFNLEYAADPQVAPDGATVAYVRTSMDRMTDRPVGAVWTVDLASGAHLPLITEEGSVSSPRWSPDGERLLYIAPGEDGAELRVLWLEEGRSARVAQLADAPEGPTWSPDGTRIAFAMFTPADGPRFATPPTPPEGAEWAEGVRVIDTLPFRVDGAGYLRAGFTHAYVVPAEGGAPRQVTEGEHDFDSPAWLNDATLLVVGNVNDDADLDPIESDIFAVDLASLERTALTSRDGPDSAPQASPDGTFIAYAGYDDRTLAYQQTDLYVMAADGSGVRNLTADYDRSIGGFMWSSDRRRLIAQVEDSGEVALVSISPDGNVAELTRDVGAVAITRPYASGAFDVGGAPGRPVIAYTQSRPGRPADLAVIAGDANPRRLTDLNEDALGHVDLAPLQRIEVASPVDGRAIEAWVATPPGFEADGTAPLILEIHGGPFAMYGPTFSAEIQRYAAEGYVAAYANPRGSTGYGEEFAALINLAYPGEDYDDLMAVVDALVEQDFVDADRLFVTGGSGGGTLTAWIIGKTDRFAAAASIKPVMNWTTMALAADFAAFFKRHWMQAEPWENRERYWALSPISLAGNVSTPTMVMVGEEDWRTPTWEAEQLYTALKLRQVDTALVRVPGASHFIAARPSHLIAKVDNIMGWFARYDPAKAEDEE
ncbi:MAG: S9 family peptidase, partial [Caulobacterales bacterium]|nr:S9 family peptidase [Caulobacterales bacterium]